MHRILVAVAICLPVLPALSQTPAPAAKAPPSLTWDVISVKPNHSMNSSGMVGWTADGFQMQNLALTSVILNAFEIKSNNQVIGLPNWADSDHFDIAAKMDAEAAAEYHKLNREERSVQSHLLFRRILEERFGLKFHIEKRELPVYKLVVVKQGPKLQEAAPNEPSSSYSGPGKLNFHRSRIGSLIFGLSNSVDRIVIDDTKLTGEYNMELSWSPDDEPDSGPSIFTALQDQLGLKLEPAKAPVDVVVIDHLERPSEN